MTLIVFVQMRDHFEHAFFNQKSAEYLIKLWSTLIKWGTVQVFINID